ncbi:ABC transporter ATP-binding protein [Ignisphaera sp. 4213-co]|uniref:ABC transporter ATP-binding protein n=1 Tax=Ignisphaera cupida TaxID=3050454 RepID=A0ABD4Z774_9CREN|nr:ABC transporter ATP-binding protein [Ignisphaera sp. 4213-co]MDK6028787.1 ABC transporter ATP-binding protein [Ignisphaera sp. 4213-co]
MVLAIESNNLYIGYESEENLILWVVEDLSLEIEHGTTFCLIGESGCGKSTIGNAVAGLLPPYARTKGKLSIFGHTVIDGDSRRFNGVRGRVVVKIPQDPASSLNPFMTIGEQLSLAIKHYYPKLGNGDVKNKVFELLEDVKLEKNVFDLYPHQLSGGMKQRAAIALALASEPRILVADEPTSALDAYLRISIANLLKKLQKEWELTLVFITHDVSIARHVCDSIAVIYAGRVVELGEASKVLNKPMHPYTELLLMAIPRRLSRERLVDIPGMPPPPGKYPSGCKFHPRCPYVFDKCRLLEPLLKKLDSEAVRCWKYYE